MTELLHITERATWSDAAAAGEYRQSTRGVTLAEQGFIHCSLPEQLPAVAEYLYRDAGDLVVLVIDSERVPAPVRYEAAGPDEPRYPHIYGPVPIAAVTKVIELTRDPTGRWQLPGYDAPLR